MPRIVVDMSDRAYAALRDGWGWDALKCPTFAHRLAWLAESHADASVPLPP